MNKLDPQIKLVWSVSYLFKGIFLSIAVFIFEVLTMKSNFGLGFIPFGWTSGLVFILSVIASIAIPPFKYKYWNFEVRQEELYLERGIIIRVKTIAPFRRVQHLDVVQTIFDRILGLAKLLVYTAGTRGADIIIPGLPLEYAEALRDKLKNYSVEDAV